MSAIIEKTIASLPNLLTAAVTGRPELLTENQPSSALQLFMRKSRNISTKQEEEVFISTEISKLKDKLSTPTIKTRAKRECLVCLLYCHLLGYDVSFAYIHAVKQAQQGNALEKRCGYLLCGLFLDGNNDLAMLLVNTILKDIRSTSIIDICTALTAVITIANAEMVPALIPAVTERLAHQKEIVRKKCVLCLMRFQQLAPDIMEEHRQVFDQALCDKSPSVVWVAVCYFLSVAQVNANRFKHLSSILVGILKQIIEHKLAAENNFQGVPAPWLSIHLLKLLSLLGKEDQGTSCQMYPVLNDVLQRTEASTKTGLAVIYEALMTISVIHPEPELLDKAAKCVSKFLSATNVTLRYLGIKALSELVRVSPRFALAHQAIVMECLEHKDPTVQNQAYELLYGMANPKNLQVISGKLLERLSQTEEDYLRKSIVTKLLELCDRYDKQFDWYIRTMNEILMHATQELIPVHTVNKLLTVIFNATSSCKNTAARTYWMVLHNDDVPDSLLQVALLTVCEYWSLIPDISANEITDCVLPWMAKCNSTITQRCAVLGLQKLLPNTTQDQRTVYLSSIEDLIRRSDIKDQQILRELKGVAESCHVSRTTKDSTKSEDKFDFTLSFLDGYVLKALENGAFIYKPPNLRKMPKCGIAGSKLERESLRFESYAASYSPKSAASFDQSLYRSGSGSFTQDSPKESIQLIVKKNVWGKDGYNIDAPDSENKEQNSEDILFSKQVEEELKKSKLASALFQGIEDTEIPMTSASSLNLGLVENDFTAGFETTIAQTNQPILANSIGYSSLGFDGISDQSASTGFEQSVSMSDDVKLKAHRNKPSPIMSHIGPLRACADNKINTENHTLHQASITERNDEFHRHKYANLLDENFEADSLDGSPSKEVILVGFQTDKNLECD